MKDQFVTYEIAKRLKKLGFNEQCFGLIKPDNNLIIEDQYLYITNIDVHNENCAAPLWQQAIDWLREKHNLIVWFDPNGREWALLTQKNVSYYPSEGTRQAAIEKALTLIK
jgi:hypothetical protein